MEIIEVNSKKELIQFIKFPMNLYAGQKFFVPPIIKSEIQTLGKEHNPAFEFCNTKYWIVKEKKKIVGRIAGIINNFENSIIEDKIARFGWVDFTNDIKIADLLFKKAEEWARSKNANKIHGPFGFTSFDRSGILVEGFNEMPTSFSNYNYSYYQAIIEKLGYKKEYDWVEYNIKVPDTLPEKISKGARLVKERFGLELVPINHKSDIKQYKDDLFSLLNESYSGLNGFTAITGKQFDKLYQLFYQFTKPDFIALVKDQNKNIIGMGFTIPSLSKAMIKMKGKLLPFGIWHIRNAMKKNDTVDMLLIAIKPEYQKKGGHALIFEHIGKGFINNGIKQMESTKELAHNNNVQNLWSNYEYRLHKRSRCYIKYL